METQCFNCEGPASDRYTLVLESGEMLEDQPMCDGCVAFFDDSYSIEVVDSPVIVRSGDEDEPD